MKIVFKNTLIIMARRIKTRALPSEKKSAAWYYERAYNSV